MKNFAKHIPNALTCMNLAFGCYACILGLCGDFAGAAAAVFIAAALDFADGLAARLLKAFSPIGKDLDSLADMVSFGVAPGMMLFHFIDVEQKAAFAENPAAGKLFLAASFAIPVLSALRLAKFNNDPRQAASFIGLPVPAHAIFWVSLLTALNTNSFATPLAELVAVSALAIATSLLLVSGIPMFSLKTKSLAWKGNELRYILAIAAAVLVLCFGMAGVALAIVLYVLLSILNKKSA